MKRILNLILTLVGVLSLSTAMAQKIDFTIRFNATTSEYEVYGRPDFSAATFNVGGGTQITVVLPKSIADAPLTITSVSGGIWADNSQVYAPTAAPNSDFHGVSTTGAPIAWVSGQEKLLYKFTLTGGCVSGVRLFENTSDPQSDAPGMLFGDFNNYMGNALNFADVYQSNYDNTGTTCSTNQKPIATDDITQTPQGKPVSGNVLPNDFDPDGGVLTVSTTPTQQPTKGIVELKPDGTFTYTPNPGVTGTDKFCYRVCDNGSPTQCDTACVTVNILPAPTPGNDKPVASDDNSQTYQNTAVVIAVKANDFDPDASGAPNGTLGSPTKLTDPANGTVSFNADGTVTYTPKAGFTGKDSFTYSICDNGTPSLCDTATVSLEVLLTPAAGNKPPVAVDDANQTLKNVSVSGTVAANDSDPDNNIPLTFSTLGSVVPGLTLNANGTYSYTPATNFVGTVSQKYKVCDSGSPVACDTATLVITVLDDNTNPPLVVIPPIVTEQDKPVTVCGNINDPDTGDTHNVTVCGAPAKGSIGTPTVNNTTHKVCLTFTPTAGQTGNDQVCLIVCDQTGKCDTVTVPIVITPALPPAVTPKPPVVVVTPIVTPQDSTTTTCMPIIDQNGTGTNTFTICGAAKNGTANPVTTTGGQLCVTYKPNAGFVGRDSLCVIVCDASNLCDTVTIPITVYPKVVPGTQQPPVVVLPPIVTKPGTPVTICGPVNDPNVSDTHTVTLCNTPTKGTVSSLSVNNTTHQLCMTYTPKAGETGNDKVCVTVCDQTNKCTTVEVPVTILPVTPNQKPIATDDITQTPQDKPVSGNVLPNDFDPDGGVLTVSTTPTQQPTKGTVQLNPDGSYTYTPTPGATGTDKFCYRVCDNGSPSLCDTACVTVNILPAPTPGNDKPVASDDNSQTYQNTAVVIAVKANDFDPDASGTPNGTLGSPTKVTDPANGTVSFNADGTVTYTPKAGFVGKDSFTYRICDNGTPSLCDTATVSVEVLPTPAAGNKPPVAVDDANQTLKNTPVSGTVAANDSDPDNNIPLTFSTLGSVVPGLTLNANGTYSYTPPTNFVGTVTQKYKVCDSGVPVLCDTATLVITVLDPTPNQKPIATDDITQTPQGKPVSGNVLPNDFDPDGGLLTVSTTPTQQPTKGTVDLNPDGTFTYTPNPEATGTDKFCYRVCDNGSPTQCDTACVTVNILPAPTPGNDKPVASDDNSQTYQNTAVVIVMKANDFDPDASGTPNGTLGTPTKLTDPANGTVVFNADGTVTYTPKAGFTGKDSFTYSICDNGTPSLCDTATVSVEVLPTPPAGNKPPVAVDDANQTLKNTTVSGTVAANDSDPDNNTPLTFTTLGSVVPGLTLNANGTYTYTPATNFVGTVVQKYKVCDSGTPVACDTATLVITVLDPTPNQKPIATDDITQTPQDKPVNGNVLPNDFDPDGGVLTVSTTPTQQPTKGTVQLNPDGSYTYTPTPGATGTDKFCYRVCDNGSPSLCDTACVTVNILPVPVPGNDKPVASDDNSQTYQNTAVTIVVKANDFDPDAVGTPNGTLGNPTKLSDPVNGTVNFNADGTVTYTPKTGFVGKDSFTYRICDNGTPALCDTATVSVEVLPTPPAGNKPPVAVDDANQTLKNNSISGTVAANDSDPDNNTPLTFTTLGSVVPGLTLNANGTYTYTPATNFVGTVVQKYKVCDSGTPVACDTATLVITVLDPTPNQKPIATDDITQTPQDKPVNGNVLPNDFDPDGGVLTVSTTPTQQPTKGTVQLNPDGSYTYTPTPGATGTDKFCYRVCDNGSPSLCDTACVTVNILPVPVPGNDKPVASDDNSQTYQNTAVTIVVKANDFDPDAVGTPNGTLGNPTKLSDPVNGTVNFNADGTVTYTPKAGFTGKDSFTYRICDNGTPSLCDTATVSVEVLPTPAAGNKPPVAVDDANQTLKNVSVSGTVAANDSDPDNNIPLTFSTLGSVVPGLTLNANGTYSYTPATNFVGTVTQKYKVCDSGSPVACDTATLVITVLDPNNQKPIATDDITQTPQGKPVSGNVLPNDFDPDGGVLTVSTTPTQQPTKGTVQLNPDGTFTYTPNPTATGTDSFCYRVCDNGSPTQCDTACVTVNIIPAPTPGNDKPIASDDNSQTYQNTAVVIAVKANDFDPDASGTPNGTLGTPTKLTDPANGTVVFNADGTVTYTPKAGFVGKDSFTYRICDNGTPALCDTATVSVEVLPTPPAGNKPPVAVDDANQTLKNTTVSGTVAANDSDPDNNTPLTFTTLGSVVPGLTLNANGTYTYTPATNFVGTVSQKYKVCDSGSPVACDTATLVITVLDPTPNQKPIATDDITQTPQDKPVSGNVLPNDFDPDGGVLTVSTTPTQQPTKGTVQLNPDGSYTYTPTPGATGTDKFCYRVCDNGSPSLCDTACVTVNILPVPIPGNDKPVASDDNSQTYQNTAVTIVVKANDTDADGNATLGNPTKLTDPVNGTVNFNADGTVTYTPKTGFVGKDSFTYRICDNGTPALCDTATVSVEVLPTPPAGNKPPVAVDDANQTTKNTPVSGTVAANDSDPDNNIPLIFSTLGSVVPGLTLNANGTYSYTPTTNFVGTVTQKYKVCDSGSPVACDTATLVITVLDPNNQKPIATDDITQTPQGKPVSGNVLPNDFDPDGGVLTVSTTPTQQPTKGQVQLNPDGTFTYTPNPGVTGTDKFCYRVCDNGSPSLCDTACVTVNIIPTPVAGNDKPVASDDNSQTYQDTPVVVVVKANDFDPDASGTPNGTLGNPTKVTDPANGTVAFNADGTVTYTPKTGFTGKDSFTYRICDNGTPSLCDTATVSVEVLPIPPAGNKPPVAIDDINFTKVNTAVGGTVAANDSDPDAGQTLTFSKQTDPINGQISFNADGTYTYTPNANFVGSDYFTYKVCDSGSPQLCDIATVIIAIVPASAKVCLQAKVYLQGALFGVFMPDTLMRDDLRVKGYLPTTSPYPAMGMSGITNANTSTLAVLGTNSASGKDAIVDWVFVELRDKANTSIVVDSRSALVQRDGDIVDTDGVSPITFNAATPNSYYVVVKHRNHLGVMSKTPVDMLSSCGQIDFRKTTTATFNLDPTNAINQAQVVVEQGVALWAGNALHDTQVIYQGNSNDVNVIYQQVINYVGNVFVSKFYTLRGYFNGDINLNGDTIFQGTGNDVEYIYQNIIKNHPGNVLSQKFFIIKEQIP